MMIHEVTAKTGTYKKRKRIGRGIGSGHGKTSGRGTKGAGSRLGWSGSIRPSREGGQMPLFRRIPKRGFSNAKFETLYYTINVRSIDARFDAGAEVNPDTLVKVGLIPNTKLPVKVLGDGEITKALKISAARFSVIAKEKIEKAGGTATVLE
jgi:large subunit ribosomal protein L15